MNSFRLLVLLGSTAAVSAAPIHAQGCSSTLSANTSTISVTTGGVQTITLNVSPAPVGGFYSFSIVGSFSGTNPGFAYFAQGGLFLNRDRYLDLSYTGRSPFLPGGAPGAPGGHVLLVGPSGTAVQQVVVAPGTWSALVGRTVQHGVYTLDMNEWPSCGSNSVGLTFVP